MIGRERNVFDQSKHVEWPRRRLLHRSRSTTTVADKTVGVPRVHGCIGIYFGKYIEYGLQKESLLCACWKRYRRNCKGTHCGNHRFPQSGHVVRYGEKRGLSRVCTIHQMHCICICTRIRGVSGGLSLQMILWVI